VEVFSCGKTTGDDIRVATRGKGGNGAPATGKRSSVMRRERFCYVVREQVAVGAALFTSYSWRMSILPHFVGSFSFVVRVEGNVPQGQLMAVGAA